MILEEKILIFGYHTAQNYLTYTSDCAPLQTGRYEIQNARLAKLEFDNTVQIHIARAHVKIPGDQDLGRKDE